MKENTKKSRAFFIVFFFISVSSHTVREHILFWKSCAAEHLEELSQRLSLRVPVWSPGERGSCSRWRPTSWKTLLRLLGSCWRAPLFETLQSNNWCRSSCGPKRRGHAEATLVFSFRFNSLLNVCVCLPLQSERLHSQSWLQHRGTNCDTCPSSAWPPTSRCCFGLCSFSQMSPYSCSVETSWLLHL